MVKIFHTGDCHLDSTFCKLSPSCRVLERQHQRDIFSKMMRYAKDNAFDAVLISGDLFDSGSVSPETEECVLSNFKELDCPVIIAPGNHDCISKTPFYKKVLPENVYIFNSEKMQVYQFDELNLQVCGYAFTDEAYRGNPLDGFNLPSFDGYSVLCAHTELDAAISNYAPLSSSDIANAGFNYAALGHTHNFRDILNVGNSVIAYCSYPESRGFDESEIGCACEVTFEGDKVNVKRVNFGERRYITKETDISSCLDLADVCNLVSKETENYGKDVALKLVLCGEVAEDLIIDSGKVLDSIGKDVFFAKIKDKTLQRLDFSGFENDFTIRGEVYRVLKPDLESKDAEQRKLATDALKVAISAIEGRSFTV